MRTRKRTELGHEGEYVAEIDVDLIETDEGWSPYLSLEGTYSLDDVRDALRRGVFLLLIFHSWAKSMRALRSLTLLMYWRGEPLVTSSG
jgi:hypothetical protein